MIPTNFGTGIAQIGIKMRALGGKNGIQIPTRGNKF